MNNEENIKQGIRFALENQGDIASSTISSQYVDDVQTAIQELESAMNSNSHINNGIPSLAGYVAEDWHAKTFNLDAILKESNIRATAEGSNRLGSIDVSTSAGEGYSLKYYATASDSAREQAVNFIEAYHKYSSKSANPVSFDEYLLKHDYDTEKQQLLQSIYHGQGRIVPSDQLLDAIKFLEKKIATESLKDGANRHEIYQSYLDTLQNLTDRIKHESGVESMPLTKQEAEVLAALRKEGAFKAEDFGIEISKLITSEYILKQTLKAGYTSAVINLVLKIGPEIYKAINYLIQTGRINLKEFKAVGFKALSVGSEGFVRGAIAGWLTISIKTGKVGHSLMSINPGTVGAITAIVFDTMTNAYEVAVGNMKPREMADHLIKEIIVAYATVKSGVIMQTLLPQLPVLGYMLGSLLGSIVASVVYDVVHKKLLSFCADTGFTFFGLVEQNYELPQVVIDRIGLNFIPISRVNIDYIPIDTIPISYDNVDRLKISTIDLVVLRRGVIGINKIGYVY